MYIPPPIIYAGLYLLSFWIQGLLPVSDVWLQAAWCFFAGWVGIGISMLLLFSALLRFIQTGNTFVTMKPASSLQTGGIYTFTRNPMYLGLLALYTGFAFFFGNSWTFILIPVLIFIINVYVIRKEELYLSQQFGEDYSAYRKHTRRWI